MKKRNFFRIYLLAVLLLLLWVAESQASAPDSLRVKWLNGRKYILHKVIAKETFTSISRRYSVSISELMKANPGVDPLKTGQIINVPSLVATDNSNASAAPGKTSISENTTSNAVATPSGSKNSSSSSALHKNHIVRAGENLFRIATLYGMKVEELKTLNQLSSNKLAVGQKLKVTVRPASESAPVLTTGNPSDKGVQPDEKNESAAPSVKPAPPVTPSAPIKTEDRNAVKPQDTAADNRKTDTHVSELPKVYTNPGTSRSSVVEKDPKTGLEVEKVTEVGVATWIEDSELNQNKYYALHRTAKPGTIIKITNRMNNNAVFVKVVGVLPETGDNENIIVKVTQAAAQRIGALDKKFTAELSYGISR